MTQTIFTKPRLTSARLSWFDDGCCDVIYLDVWQDTAVSFAPPTPKNKGWQSFQRQTTIARDESGDLFRQAADLLMRFQFYPKKRMSHFGDFDLGSGRWLRQGDRVVQRFHVWQLWGRPILDVLGLVQISKVVVEPQQVGYDYVSVQPHTIEGKWSFRLKWRTNGDLLLRQESISRPSVKEPSHNHKRIHHWQEQLYREGVPHFQQLLNSSTNQHLP